MFEKLQLAALQMYKTHFRVVYDRRRGLPSKTTK